MKAAQYIGVIHKSGDSDFGVSFPDLPGVVTAGKTLKEASEMAREALEFHIEGMIEDGEELPKASTLDKLKRDGDLGDWIMFARVKVEHDTVQVNVAFP